VKGRTGKGPSTRPAPTSSADPDARPSEAGDEPRVPAPSAAAEPALAMLNPSSLVELKVRAPPPSHWLQDLGSRWGAAVQVHICRPLGKDPGHLLRLLEIVAAPDRIPAILQFLGENGGDENLAVTRLAPHRLLVRLVSPTPPLCTTVFEMGAICTSCPFLPDAAAADPEKGAFTWGLLSPSASGMLPLLESFRAPGSPPPQLVKIGEYQSVRPLTARQEAALDVAVRLGYFETPRRSGLAEVAKALGVSRATAMEVLRRALQKLTDRWMEGSTFPIGERPSSGEGGADG
jgi:hypothetical protein